MKLFFAHICFRKYVFSEGRGLSKTTHQQDLGLRFKYGQRRHCCPNWVFWDKKAKSLS